MVTNNDHALTSDPEKCIGCVDCTRACPTGAIRVRGGHAVVNYDLCTDCGFCIHVCHSDAMRARTTSLADLKKFKYTVAMPSLTLYAQFGHEVLPDQILHALKKIGFDDYCDISWMCEMVGVATEAYLAECRGPWPKISDTCPAIVRLLLVRYPDLIPHTIPIETPRELAAKLTRRKLVQQLGLAPEEIGIFFITPCTAIMNSIERPVGLSESYLDGAFSIQEVYGPLLKALKEVPPTVRVDGGISVRGLGWAQAGGEINSMRNSNTLTVRGVQDITRVFDRIESGKFQSVDFIEAYSCYEGCVSGQLAVESRAAAQRTIQNLSRRLRSATPVKEEKIRSLMESRFFAFEGEIKAREVKPLAMDLRGAIKLRSDKAALRAKVPGKNCAACGAPDCDTLVDDVLRGEAKIEDCPFIEIDRLRGQLGKSQGRARRSRTDPPAPACGKRATMLKGGAQ